MPNKLNLIGKRYGKLLVVSPAERINNETAWTCRCDCGAHIVVRTRMLRKNKKKSCGCTSYKGITTLHYVDGTCIEMIKNKKIRSNNSSGCTGVSYVGKTGKWRAEIMISGRKISLGTFAEKADAIVARKEGEKKYHDELIEKYSS